MQRREVKLWAKRGAVPARFKFYMKEKSSRIREPGPRDSACPP